MLRLEMSLELQQVPTLIVGNSQKTRDMRALAERLGSTDYTLLVQGETGTGKEVFAREIHNRNGRQNSPFVPVNCSAVPELLFESELFGHRKGAFTGAHEDREGHLQSAGDGTIFLDEVGTLPLNLQVKLLRVLQDGIFSPVGDRRQLKMKARVIAATNSDLEKAVSKGNFREDLFYRLNVIPFLIPPLRERSDDIPELANHFLRQEQVSRNFSSEAMAIMMGYHWPGNVRELKNAVIRAVFYSAAKEDIKPEHVHPYLKCLDIQVETDKKFPTFEELQKDYFREMLRKCHGNITRAAKVAGMSVRAMTHQVNKFQLRAFIDSLKES